MASSLTRSLGEVMSVRRLQTEIAELAAGRSTAELRALEAARSTHDGALSDAVEGYQRNLASVQFSQPMSESWRASVEAGALALDAHDERIADGREMAERSSAEWNWARGRQAVCGKLFDKAFRNDARRLEDKRLAAAIDIHVTRKFGR